MEFAWLQPDRPCERQHFGDAAVGLGILGQQGYPICPTLMIPVAAWQGYQQTIAPDPLPSHPEKITQLCQTLQKVEPALARLQHLTQACVTLKSPAIAIRPSLITQTGIPWELQDLWPAQVCRNQPDAIVIALHHLWIGLLSPHSLWSYRHLKIAGSDLRIAILVQPLAQPIASGQFTQTSTTWSLEAIWGFGYGWRSRCVFPDYYTGDIRADRLLSASLKLTQHIQGSKHRADYIEYDGQPHCRQVPETQQNQWVFSNQQLQTLFTNFAPVTPAPGQYFWQQLPDGQFEFTHWRPAPNSHTLSPAAVQTQSSPALDSSVRLQGSGVVPGTIAAPITLVTHQTRSLPPQTILVAVTLTIEQIALLSEAVGLILEQGSATSHCVIVARELRIPTIVGVMGAIAHLQDTQTFVLDADRGCVYPPNHSPPTLARADAQVAEPVTPATTRETTTIPTIKSTFHATEHHLKPHPATQIQVWGMLNHAQGLRSPFLTNLAGIGLVRSELLLMSLCPGENVGTWLTSGDRAQSQLQNTLLELAHHLAPQPLFYRLADWRYPEFPALPGARPPVSVSSALGVRGVLSAQQNPLLFNVELAALRTVCAQYSNVSVIVPFVRRVSELSWVRDRLQEQQVQPQQLWVMAETPAIAFDLPAYQAAGAQGVAIGINDLTQLTLGIDRELAALSRADDWCHPAVQQSLQHIIQRSQQLGLPCSLCASLDWAEHSSFVQDLSHWGITAIVTELSRVNAAHQAIIQAKQG